jgi:uncharacterized membrane protein
MVRATLVTQVAARLIYATILATAAYLVVQYPDLPDLLPVRFRANGIPNGWQYRTLTRVLVPVFVQLALAVLLGAIGALLLTRRRGRDDLQAPDVRAAAVASEAVVLIALIWVVFQGYAAWALVRMWEAQRGGLGLWYFYLEGLGLVVTVIVAMRANARLGRPAPRPFVPEHWWLGQLYHNSDDPALFVPARDGRRWTLNFGRPIAAALLAVVIAMGIIGPTILLGWALRYA